MTSHQRVLATLNHQEPDRIPLFGPNIIQTHEPYDQRLRQFHRIIFQITGRAVNRVKQPLRIEWT